MELKMKILGYVNRSTLVNFLGVSRESRLLASKFKARIPTAASLRFGETTRRTLCTYRWYGQDASEKIIVTFFGEEDHSRTIVKPGETATYNEKTEKRVGFEGIVKERTPSIFFQVPNRSSGFVWDATDGDVPSLLEAHEVYDLRPRKSKSSINIRGEELELHSRRLTSGPVNELVQQWLAGQRKIKKVKTNTEGCNPMVKEDFNGISAVKRDLHYRIEGVQGTLIATFNPYRMYFGEPEC
ncbi:hypothetical protein OESDEN_06478 [Oesophagostomum dentatum]|uniref:Uncharacterized protein n=1 Tax=Oesophagostomum dentatum TaxID=61180 RepID=A0A0B1TBX1_OESDE|nr:hypothetical protein OESDEN_06478 [Oesophagostomum dentatum]